MRGRGVYRRLFAVQTKTLIVLRVLWYLSSTVSTRKVHMYRLFTTILMIAALDLCHAADDIIQIPGGEFMMGCTGCTMADALPIHRVAIQSFKISKTPVTNKQFKLFVSQTSYVTTAERPLDPKDFPGVPKEKLKIGSTLFRFPSFFRGFANPLDWWEYREGASWKTPKGPKGPKAIDNHPVVHVSYRDAVEYCRFKGGRLPTEAEYEYAARGGLKGKRYSWGDVLKPNGKWAANIWQGSFPMHNTKEDGFIGLSPVMSFPPNGYGLYDMGGNVWHWTSDWYRPDYFQNLHALKKTAKNPKGPGSSFDPNEPGALKKVQKGGSHLCSDRYCSRYFVGSRGKGEVSTGSGNLSFRCVFK